MKFNKPASLGFILGFFVLASIFQYGYLNILALINGIIGLSLTILVGFLGGKRK